MLDGGCEVCNALQMRKATGDDWARFFAWIQEEGAMRGFPTIDAIANAAGISGATIGRWATSTNGPTLGKLAEVADALGVSMAQIGAAFDEARGANTTEAGHRPWPSFAEFVANVADVNEDEADVLVQTLDAVRAAKKGKRRRTIIVT